MINSDDRAKVVKVILVPLSLVFMIFVIYASNNEAFSNAFWGDRYTNTLMINKAIIVAANNNDIDALDKYIEHRKLNLYIETFKGDSPAIAIATNPNLPKRFYEKIARDFDYDFQFSNGFNIFDFAMFAFNYKFFLSTNKISPEKLTLHKLNLILEKTRNLSVKSIARKAEKANFISALTVLLNQKINNSK